MRFPRYGTVLVATALTLVVAPAVAGATAIHVTSFADSGGACTLRNAINAANSNAAAGACPAGQVAPTVDTIDFPSASASTITLSNALPPVSGPVTIAGPGIAQLEINGVATYQPFKIASGVVTISGLTINNGKCNEACGSQGGAINNSGTLTLDKIVIAGSSASSTTAGAMNSFAEGGAIENTGGSTLTITDSSIRNNTATALGAVFTVMGTGQNGASGGAIMNRGTLTIARSTISGNAVIANAGAGASGNAAAGGIDSKGQVSITASLISNNQATAAGAGSISGTAGGIGQFNDPAVTLTIDRSTIAGNSALTSAGGIQSIGAPGTVTNSTVFGNSAPSGANLVLSQPLNLTNTIVSNPTGSTNCSSATVVSGGYNLDSDNSCGLNQATDLKSVGSMLGALQDNGGPTFTRAPLAGSPVIDAGKVAAGDTADQRGLLRPSDINSIANATGGDGSDIGAVEVQDTVAPDTSITSGPADGSTTGKPSFAFASSEAISTFECSVDGGAFASCSSPDALSGLSDGAHTFAVRAVDGTGNKDATPASRSFTVDATAPTTKLGKFKKKTSKTKVKLKFSSEPGATFQCRVDSAPFKACKSPFKTKKLKPGKHVIEVQATDAFGNSEAKPARAKIKVTA